VRKIRTAPFGHFERESCLADPPGADQREQASAMQPVGDFGDFVLAPDKAGQLSGQVTPR